MPGAATSTSFCFADSASKATSVDVAGRLEVALDKASEVLGPGAGIDIVALIPPPNPNRLLCCLQAQVSFSKESIARHNQWKIYQSSNTYLVDFFIGSFLGLSTFRGTIALAAPDALALGLASISTCWAAAPLVLAGDGGLAGIGLAAGGGDASRTRFSGRGL